MKTIRYVLGTIGKSNSYNYDRGKSWEHCYAFYSNYRDIRKDEGLLDQAALHLYCYLGSWGMFRNSFLMQTDYKFFVPIARVLTTASDTLWRSDLLWEDLSNEREESNLRLLFEFYEKLHDTIEQEKKGIYRESGVNKIGGTTDTLMTKIIMGTMGCVPAYDENFRKGLKNILKEKGLKKRGITNFKPESFKDLLHLSRELWLSEIYTAQKEIPATRTELKYPPMKLLDLYFWLHGFHKDW